MPIQAPQWTDYLNCPACCREFSPRRSPVSLSCGHTLCKPCLKNITRKQCPFDQTVFSMDLEELMVNTALLQLMGYDPPAQPAHPSTIKSLPEQDRRAYDSIVKDLEQLAVYLKSCCTASVNMQHNRLSRPMQRKLVALLQCSLMDEEGRGKAARAARSLGERTVSELILQHQNPQQLSTNLWAAVRARGCQFLGPAMQEEVMKLVLLALEDGSPLSRKVLVMFVVQQLEPHFPQASKTSIGHVVQLLYRASCFKVSKRDSDSSLMELKDEFRTYEALRREHDAQIVQIATESGLRIAPDQWSALLYGDTLHKSHMQSIIDKLQTPHSFAQSVQELFFALQRAGDPAQLLLMTISLDRLINIDPSPDAKSPSWQELSHIISALKDVVSGLVDCIQNHAVARDGNHNIKADRLPDPTTQPLTMASPYPGRYKVVMCRNVQMRTYCPRGSKCTYAHNEEELERYRRMETPNGQGTQQPRPSVPRAPAPRMLMQQSSPPASGRSPGRGDGPNEFGQEHARGLTHNRITYANALVYGGNNNRQSQNENNGPIPQDATNRTPNEGSNQQNEAMIYHNRCISPQDVQLNQLGGRISPHNGSMGPLNVVTGTINLAVVPIVGGAASFDVGAHNFNGGVTPYNGASPFINRVSPHNGVFSPINAGYNSYNGGMGYSGRINYNTLGDAIYTNYYNGQMVPHNNGIIHMNRGGFHPDCFSPLGSVANQMNIGMPPNHRPPTDSKFFPRQTAQIQSFQSQNDSVQMGGTPAFQGMGATAPEHNWPDFSLRPDGEVPSDLPSIESFGLDSGIMSRFEDRTQPETSPKNDTPVQQSMFMFNKKVKNLPEGVKPYESLPMGINFPQNGRSGPNMQPSGSNGPSCSMYSDQEAVVNQHMAMLDIQNPDEEISVDTATNTDDTIEPENKAVLDDLRILAIQVAYECSDAERG